MIKIPVTAELQAEMENSHWGANPIRTDYPGSAHAEIVDILLRGPADLTRPLPELYGELECVDYPLFEQFPETSGVANAIMVMSSASKMGRVILTRLAPNGVIYPHIDEGPVPLYYNRYHFCIQGGLGNLFVVDNVSTHMHPGEAHYVDVRQKHMVANLTEDDRVHLIVDVK